MVELVYEEWWNRSEKNLVCKIEGKMNGLKKVNRKWLLLLSFNVITEQLCMKLVGAGFKTAGLKQTCYRACTCLVEFFTTGLYDYQKSLQLQKALGLLVKKIDVFYCLCKDIFKHEIIESWQDILGRYCYMLALLQSFSHLRSKLLVIAVGR